MTRTRIGVALAILALALLALPGEAIGAPTWEGTWSSTFGEIKMTAGGSGTYPNCGTISGGLSDGGLTNKGTWQECSTNGKYEFHMGSSGGSFTGTYTRGESDTCASPPCTWNGSCIAGPCTGNSDPPPSEPVACGASAANGLAAAKTCDLGKLPFGTQVSVPMPPPDKTTNVSPREIPSETYRLILEIIAEEEGERLHAALVAKLGDEKLTESALGYCYMLLRRPFEDDSGYVTDEGGTALFNACARLLLSEPPAPASARPAATRCYVKVVPLFEKGTKVTKRRIRKAKAAANERVKASCDPKRKGFVASLKARGEGATLNRMTGKKIGAPLARLSDTPANGRRVNVRWRARRR